jgi:ElaB/YqjD/DUF883 family membrane-anchored ribosome-binding protein
MAPTQNNLPEGTDTIINGAAQIDGNEQAPPPGTSFDPAPAKAGAVTPPADTVFEPEATGGGLRERIGEKAGELKDQAADKARAYADQGKERATDALSNLARMIEDTASTIDEKVGPQYGDYARRAAQTVSGYATSLGNKNVDELLSDVRETVRKSPAVAIGVAAALGFIVARVIKSASEPGDSGNPPAGPAA